MDLLTLQKAAAAAVESARADGKNITVVIVDARGHELLLLRDGAPWFTAGIARAKAATAAALGMPSDDYAAMVRAYPELAPLIDAQVNHALTTLPGGRPVAVDGDVVAGVGVSGAQAEEDVKYARIVVAQLV